MSRLLGDFRGTMVSLTTFDEDALPPHVLFFSYFQSFLRNLHFVVEDSQVPRIVYISRSFPVFSAV